MHCHYRSTVSGAKVDLPSGVVGSILSSIREATDKKVGIEGITFSQCQHHHRLCRISHLNEIILAEPLNLFSDSQNQDVDSSSTSASSDLRSLLIVASSDVSQYFCQRVEAEVH